VETIEMEEGKPNVHVVRLLTKTKENTEQSKEVRIRGTNLIVLN